MSALYVLNFYSPVFVDQLKRGRKTATIRLGDKTRKYKRGQVVWITVGYRHSPREKIFAAVIDDVEVKRVKELSPRDIEHDNPEFRRLEETVNFLEQIYSRPVVRGRQVTVIRFSQIVERPAVAVRQRRDPAPGTTPGGRWRATVPHHLAAGGAARGRLGRDLGVRSAGRSGGAASSRRPRSSPGTASRRRPPRRATSGEAGSPTDRVRIVDDRGRAAGPARGRRDR